LEKELQSDLDGKKWQPPKQPRKTYEQPPFQAAAARRGPWTDQQEPKMQPRQCHQSESSIKRDPGLAVPRDPPQQTTETQREADDQEAFMAALCERLTRSIKAELTSELVPRIQSPEAKFEARKEARDYEQREYEPEPMHKATHDTFGRSSPQGYRYRDRDDREGYRENHQDWSSKPRFRPDSLPQMNYGDDVSMWIAEMDHVVIQHGEEGCWESF
jgi:hypothetical protein